MQKFSLLFALMLSSLLAFAQKKHIVESGQTLSSIAKQYYNDPKKWVMIFDLNKNKDLEVVSTDVVIGVDAEGKEIKVKVTPPKRIVNPNFIYVGQMLVLPNIQVLSDRDIEKAMVGYWESAKEYHFVPIKFYMDRTYDFQNLKGKYSIVDGIVWIENLGEFVIDQAELKSGRINLVIVKDIIQDTSVTNSLKNLRHTSGPCGPNIHKLNVSGRVLDQSTGNPIAGVKVSAGSSSAMTDAEGFYNLTEVNPGSQVAFSAKDYKGMSKAAAETVNVALERIAPKILNATVEFEVKAGKTGKEKAISNAVMTANNTKTFKAEPSDKNGMAKAEFSYEENVVPQFTIKASNYEARNISYDGQSKYSVILIKKAKDRK